MSDKQVLVRSFLHALLAAVYVFLVALLMSNGEVLFGNNEPTLLAPFAFLMLFVLSAAIMGILVLGKPALLYLDNQKKDGIKFLFYTVGWLLVFTALALIYLVGAR